MRALCWAMVGCVLLAGPSPSWGQEKKPKDTKAASNDDNKSADKKPDNKKPADTKPADKEPKDTKPKSDLDLAKPRTRVGYALGVYLSRQMLPFAEYIDTKAFKEGLDHGLAGDKPLLSQGQRDASSSC